MAWKLSWITISSPIHTSFAFPRLRAANRHVVNKRANASNCAKPKRPSNHHFASARPAAAPPFFHRPTNSIPRRRAMDRADPARGRLAVLSSHLRAAAAAGVGEAARLETSPVSAPAPGPRAGVLAVVDGRTGKRHEVKVSEDGTVRATDFKKVRSSERAQN